MAGHSQETGYHRAEADEPRAQVSDEIKEACPRGSRLSANVSRISRPSPGNRLMAAPMTPGSHLGVGAPVQLFRIASEVGFTRRIWYTSYDVSRSGQRFLVNVAETNPLPIDE